MKISRAPLTSSSDGSRYKPIHEERLSARVNQVESPSIEIEMGGKERRSVLLIEFESKDVFALHERVLRARLNDSKRLVRVIKEMRKAAEALRKIREIAVIGRSDGKPDSLESIIKTADSALERLRPLA